MGKGEGRGEGHGEGRGEGKGGCGVFDAIGDCIQCISCCLCCLCVTGPVLMIVGILFISSAFSDGRGKRIDEFNVAVEAWADGTVDAFSNTSGWTYEVLNSCSPPRLAAKSLEASDTAEKLGSESDETDVFASYTRVKYTDINPDISGNASPAASSCSLQISILQQNSIVQCCAPLSSVCNACRDFTFCAPATTTCRPSSGSDVSSCHSQCSSRGGTSSGSGYSSFRCSIIDAPAEVCVRVSKTASGWVAAQGTLPDRPSGASQAGCFYKSGSWITVRREPFKGTKTLQIPVQVRHERDPYLYFVDISSGSLNFGLTTGEKLKIGFTLMAFGIIITGLVCGAAVCIVKFAWSFASGNKTERPQNALGGALYDVSAKYGAYIPGGSTAVGVPANRMPTGDVQKPPPGINVPSSGYTIGAQPGSPPGVAGYPYDHSPYGSPTAVQSANPNVPPPGYGGPQPGAPPPGYGAPPQGYGAPPPGYGAPPPAYNAAPPGYGAPPPPPPGYPPTF